MPRYNRRSISVRESVLRSSGSVETILLDERYAPYDRQGARIENLCGSFTEFVHSSPLLSVISSASGQREMFHLHGNVVLHNGRGSFLAVRGMAGLERLSRALHISSPRNVVHMVVLTSKIGRRVQVSSSLKLFALVLRADCRRRSKIALGLRADCRRRSKIALGLRADCRHRSRRLACSSSSLAGGRGTCV